MRYFPSNAGQALYDQHNDKPMMQPWAEFGLFVAYLAIAVVIVAIALRRRNV